MKLLLVFWLTASCAFGAYRDKIFDDYEEKDSQINIHSRGLLTYGAHSNTFHLRHFFLRANYERDHVQFFATLNGYADTHNPGINYGYILNNINLYDYGFIFRIWDGFFLSPRAAAPYREDLETFLAIPAYIFGTPAEFDPVTNYLVVHKVAPGIRLGYAGERFEVGYSQGDFRHAIPTGFMAKYRFDDFYVRAVMLSEYLNPAVFDRLSLRRKIQVSSAGRYALTPKITLGGLAEVTYLDSGTWRFRVEQAVEYSGVTLGVRELFMDRGQFITEISLKRRMADMVAMGVQYGSNGSWYLVGNVDF